MSSGGPERPPPSEPDGDGAGEALANVRSMGSAWVYLLPAATLILGLLITGMLVLVSHSQFVNNEKRLIRLRVRGAGAPVAASPPGVETPLASAAELADTTKGNVARS